MSRNKRILTVMLGALLWGCSVYGVVRPVDERKEIIDTAKELLDRKVRPVERATVEKIGNPFVMVVVEEAVEEEINEEIPLSNSELVEILADFLKPNGIMALGGDYYLIFEERKVKTGHSIPVNYDGKKYKLTIDSIERNAYTIRLADAVLRIKLK